MKLSAAADNHDTGPGGGIHLDHDILRISGSPLNIRLPDIQNRFSSIPFISIHIRIGKARYIIFAFGEIYGVLGTFRLM